MEESSADWLRKHMRQHIANSSVNESTDNVLDFRPASNSPKNQGAVALDLVYQAAELIGDIDHRATERHARAEALAEQAIEKLKIADDRVRSAESARHAAEAALKEYKDSVETKLEEIEKAADDRVRSAESARHAAEAELKEYKDSVETKLEEIEKAMERAATRSVAAQAEIATAEQRAINAEMCANEAENALKRIEAAIRTQILEKSLNDFGRNAVRAA
jgi:chromosome segregation ATPase